MLRVYSRVADTNVSAAWIGQLMLEGIDNDYAAACFRTAIIESKTQRSVKLG
jgi:hypothetical protein